VCAHARAYTQELTVENATALSFLLWHSWCTRRTNGIQSASSSIISSPDFPVYAFILLAACARARKSLCHQCAFRMRQIRCGLKLTDDADIETVRQSVRQAGRQAMRLNSRKLFVLLNPRTCLLCTCPPFPCVFACPLFPFITFPVITKVDCEC